MKKSKKTAKKESKGFEITRDMMISEVVTHHPETMPLLMEYGMRCFGCPMALGETIEQGAMAHGINPAEMLEKLNKAVKAISKGKKKKR